MVTAYRRRTPDSKVASLTTGRSAFSQLQPLASSSVYSVSTWVIHTFLWRVSQWVAVYMAVRAGTVQRIHVTVKLTSHALLFRVSVPTIFMIVDSTMETKRTKFLAHTCLYRMSQSISLAVAAFQSVMYRNCCAASYEGLIVERHKLTWCRVWAVQFTSGRHIIHSCELAHFHAGKLS